MSRHHVVRLHYNLVYKHILAVPQGDLSPKEKKKNRKNIELGIENKRIFKYLKINYWALAA